MSSFFWRATSRACWVLPVNVDWLMFTVPSPTSATPPPFAASPSVIVSSRRSSVSTELTNRLAPKPLGWLPSSSVTFSIVTSAVLLPAERVSVRLCPSPDTAVLDAPAPASVSDASDPPVIDAAG